MAGTKLKLTVTLNDGLTVKYLCPGCGNPVEETTNLCEFDQSVKSIEADPLCFSCRRREIVI